MNYLPVSVVIPSCNQATFLPHCLESVLAQKYPEFEVIVVDDCSTDDSLAVALSFTERGVRVLQTSKNSGHGVARNIGIRAARHELITMIDSDDMLAPDSILKRVELMEKTGADLVHARAQVITKGITYADALQIPAGRALARARIHHQTVLIRKDVFRKYGLYDETMRERLDKELWLRLFKHAPGLKIVKGEFPVAFYRKHKHSITTQRKRNRAFKAQGNQVMAEVMRKREGGLTRANTVFLE